MQDLDKHELMILADDYAHKFAFVGDDEMPKARNALAQAVIGQCDKIARLEAECAALKAENEAIATEMRNCSANERRYLWLRDEAQYTDDKSGPFCILWKRTGDVQEILAEDELDEAVDSAMYANIQNDDAMQAGEKL